MQTPTSLAGHQRWSYGISFTYHADYFGLEEIREDKAYELTQQ